MVGRVAADPARGDQQPARRGSRPTTACTAVGVAQVGKSSVSLAEVWDGTAWRVTSLPSVPAGSPALAAVSCTAANACTAVGQQGDGGGDPTSARTLAEHWNGIAARAVHPITGAHGSGLHGVACTSASACVAAGRYQPDRHAARAALERRDLEPIDHFRPRLPGHGLVPLRERMPRGRLGLRDGQRVEQRHLITGGTADDRVGRASRALATACTAVGYANGAGAATWDGTAWTAATIPGPPTDFTGISCPAASVCTAVGFGRDTEKPVIKRSSSRWALRRAGAAWVVAVPARAGNRDP